LWRLLFGVNFLIFYPKNIWEVYTRGRLSWLKRQNLLEVQSSISTFHKWHANPTNPFQAPFLPSVMSYSERSRGIWTLASVAR
jgi:hypothetical protein